MVHFSTSAGQRVDSAAGGFSVHSPSNSSAAATSAALSCSSPCTPSSSYDGSYKEKSHDSQDDGHHHAQQPPHRAHSASASSQSPPHLSSSLASLALSKAAIDHKSAPSSALLPSVSSCTSSPSPFPLSSTSSLLCTSPSSGEEERYDVFLHWLRVNGAKFPHLTLRRYARDYRGVHIASKAEIPKGKTLLRIPHALLITVELAKASPIGGLVATLPNIGSQAILAVYLLQERGKGAASFWRYWLEVLPQSFSSLPMFFTPAELAELTGCTELLCKVRSQQKSMRDEYNSIMRLPGIQHFPPFSYDDFVWAALAVGTRVFSLCINNAKTSVLAPLADMMNHKNPAGSSWSYCNRKEAFTLTSCTHMMDGEAVYESYGVKDNKRFFASYGFCLEDNAANEVSVCIRGELMVDDRQSRSFVVRQCYDHAMEEMMAFLRYVNAYEYQQQHSLPDSYSGAAMRATTPSASSSTSSSSAFGAFSRSSFTLPLSVDNELSALYALRCACKEHLSAYPTKLEYDQSLLQSLPNTEANGNLRNILVFRIGEKRIYKWLIDFSSLGIALLCMPWEEARTKIRALTERPAGAGGAEEEERAGMLGYVSGVVAPLLQERNKAARRPGGGGGGGVSAPVGAVMVRSVVGRRLSQDVDRKMMGLGGSLADFASMEEEDEEEEEEEEDEEEEEEEEEEVPQQRQLQHSQQQQQQEEEEEENEDDDDVTEKGPDGSRPSSSLSTASHVDDGAVLASASLSSAPASHLSSSALSSKRSSLTSSLPPVTSLGRLSCAGGVASSPSARSSLMSSSTFAPSPSMSPSASPPTFTSRHLPRSAASTRSSLPRLLPAMPPVTRAASSSSSSTLTKSGFPTTFLPCRTTVSLTEQGGTTVTTSISSLPAPAPRLSSSPSSSVSILSPHPTLEASKAASKASPPLLSPSPPAAVRSTTSAQQLRAGTTMGTGAGVNAAAALSASGMYGGEGPLTAPSPTPSTSDDSQDEQGTPVDDDSSDSEDDSHSSPSSLSSAKGSGSSSAGSSSSSHTHSSSSLNSTPPSSNSSSHASRRRAAEKGSSAGTDRRRALHCAP